MIGKWPSLKLQGFLGVNIQTLVADSMLAPMIYGVSVPMTKRLFRFICRKRYGSQETCRIPSSWRCRKPTSSYKHMTAFAARHAAKGSDTDVGSRVLLDIDLASRAAPDLL